ncbi:hypothetical protein H7J07_01380 [Mycobacterium koreense]|uniref:DNA-binding protein n=1 Tax=Mycolicibacillus koreensis TaxID=1069220 RepID=UPI001056828A|nr:DNA-binding protein [Mycolicibacillus koreensis]MCV7246911.1 hypothetical protein [Mycolicibacillus koreensis]BBY54218.1 hypothetical protein MKOR_14690 [Mycolicibacillus koreensis]
MNPPPVQRLGGAVLLQGQSVVDAVYLLAQGIRAAQRDGYPTARFEGLRRAMVAAYEFQSEAAMSATRHGDVAAEVDSSQSQCELISTTEAASIAGLTVRQMQRWAQRGLGKKVGTRWLIDSDLLTAELAARRTEERSAE